MQLLSLREILLLICEPFRIFWNGEPTRERTLKLLHVIEFCRSKCFLPRGSFSNSTFVSTYNIIKTCVQVISLCGRLPLFLAVAGSMPVMEKRGSTPCALEELIQLIENVVEMMKAYGDGSDNLTSILL